MAETEASGEFSETPATLAWARHSHPGLQTRSTRSWAQSFASPQYPWNKEYENPEQGDFTESQTDALRLNNRPSLAMSRKRWVRLNDLTSQQM